VPVIQEKGHVFLEVSQKSEVKQKRKMKTLILETGYSIFAHSRSDPESFRDQDSEVFAS
jgi:hypothetical protein